MGGPIVRDKAWFYGSYNRFYIDRQISGQDPNIGTDLGLFHTFGGKITWQFSERDTFIGYAEWNRKIKPFPGAFADGTPGISGTAVRLALAAQGGVAKGLVGPYVLQNHARVLRL